MEIRNSQKSLADTFLWNDFMLRTAFSSFLSRTWILLWMLLLDFKMQHEVAGTKKYESQLTQKKKSATTGTHFKSQTAKEKLKIHSGFTVQFSLSIRHRLGRLFLVKAKSFKKANLRLFLLWLRLLLPLCGFWQGLCEYVTWRRGEMSEPVYSMPFPSPCGPVHSALFPTPSFPNQKS